MARQFAKLVEEIRAWPLFFCIIPVALAATAFTLSAEVLRMEGRHAWGDFFDILKLLVYAAWLTSAWRSAANTAHLPARLAGQLAVAAGVVTVALTV